MYTIGFRAYGVKRVHRDFKFLQLFGFPNIPQNIKTFMTLSKISVIAFLTTILEIFAGKSKTSWKSWQLYLLRFLFLSFVTKKKKNRTARLVVFEKRNSIWKFAFLCILFVMRTSQVSSPFFFVFRFGELAFTACLSFFINFRVISMIKTTKQQCEYSVSFALNAIPTSEHFKKIKFQHVNFKLYFACFVKWRVKVSSHFHLYTMYMTLCTENVSLDATAWRRYDF